MVLDMCASIKENCREIWLFVFVAFGVFQTKTYLKTVLRHDLPNELKAYLIIKNIFWSNYYKNEKTRLTIVLKVNLDCALSLTDCAIDFEIILLIKDLSLSV